MGLSNAERQERWRKRRQQQVNARIVELEKERDHYKRVAEGKGKPTKPDRGSLRNDAAEQDREIARLKARVAEIEQECDRYKQMAESRPTKLDGAPLRNDGQEARVAELEAELASARKELTDARGRYWEIRTYLELRTEGIFTRKEFNKLRSWCHPDRAQGEAEKKRHAEAYELIGRCEKLLKKEPLPKPPSLPRTAEELAEARLRVLKANRARGLKGAATRARKKPGRQLPQGA
jgi:chromosome segregation ATPase